MELSKPYFPLETDLKPEEALLIGEFGFKGYGIFIAILKKINKSYFYKIDLSNRSMIIVLGKQINCTSALLVESILKGALRYGIFDYEKYEKYKILTNEDIQLNHFRAIKTRKEIKMNIDYVLSSIIPELKKMTVYKQFFEENTPKNDKEKKTKPNKTKLNENNADASSSLEKFKKAFPDKFIEEGYKIPEYVNIDRLIACINESDFLKSAGNLTLKNLCKEKLYEKIIAGLYKDYKQSEVSQTGGRTYTKEELNKLYDDPNVIDI